MGKRGFASPHGISEPKEKGEKGRKLLPISLLQGEKKRAR